MLSKMMVVVVESPLYVVSEVNQSGPISLWTSYTVWIQTWVCAFKIIGPIRVCVLASSWFAKVIDRFTAMSNSVASFLTFLP